MFSNESLIVRLSAQYLLDKKQPPPHSPEFPHYFPRLTRYRKDVSNARDFALKGFAKDLLDVADNCGIPILPF